jgi:hypothetical protein
MTIEPSVIFKTRADARVAPKSELPPDHPARRKPLGLAPAPGDDDAAHAARAETPREPSLELPPRRAPADDRAALMSDVDVQGFVLSHVMGEELNSLEAAVKRAFDSLEGALRNEIAALKNENHSLRIILENLRITQRGERGIDGDRGPPGRDGRDGVGQLGPRGEKGEPGKAAAKITAWTINGDEFTATPVMSDGSAGATLYLRGLFEAYHSAASWLEDAYLVEAARQARAENERQIEASRWAK